MADALSRQSYPALNCLLALPKDLCEEFWKLELSIITPKTKHILYALEAQSTLIKEIQVAHATDPQLEQIKEEILVGKRFIMHEDGAIRFHNRVCVPVVEAIKKKIIDEGHNTPHSVHLRKIKLYKDLKQTFQWSNMKQEVVD